MYVFDCEFCDEELQAPGTKIKDVGKSHVLGEHYSDLEELFREKYAGKDCWSGNGCWFPVDEEVQFGFACPDCGTDHSKYFAGSHVWAVIREI